MTKQEILDIKKVLNDEYENLQKKIRNSTDDVKNRTYGIAQAEVIKIEILLEKALGISLE